MNSLFYEEILSKIFANINDWLKFAEAKNFGLISLNAAIVFGLSQSSLNENSPEFCVVFYILSPFIYLSFISSLLSFIPVLNKMAKNKSKNGLLAQMFYKEAKDSKVKNIHYYGYLRNLNKNEFIQELKIKTNSAYEFTEYESELVSQILYNSRITWLKFQLFKVAGYFLLLGSVASLVVWIIRTFFKI